MMRALTLTMLFLLTGCVGNVATDPTPDAGVEAAADAAPDPCAQTAESQYSCFRDAAPDGGSSHSTACVVDSAVMHLRGCMLNGDVWCCYPVKGR